jgi:hypothetical protein
MEAVVRDTFRFVETALFSLYLSMFLLPLILWWAHAPLRIAQGKLRVSITFTVLGAIAITAVLSRPCTAADRDDSAQQAGGSKEPTIDSPEEQHHLTTQEPSERIVLREGSAIPPTPGRIVMLGRRWAFVTKGVEKDLPQELTNGDPMKKSTVVSFLASPSRKPAPLGMNSALTDQKAPNTRLISALAPAITEQQAPPDLPQVLLVENLMLERIVEAIRADASDDRWSISGEVTEFFGENRLIIRTAQRAAGD